MYEIIVFNTFAGSFFASPMLTSSAIFGGGSTTTTNTFFGSTPVFGGAIKPDPSKPVFGQVTSNAASPKRGFERIPSTLVSSIQTTCTNESANESASTLSNKSYSENSILKFDSNLSFASLAATQNTSAFGVHKGKWPVLSVVIQ